MRTYSLAVKATEPLDGTVVDMSKRAVDPRRQDPTTGCNPYTDVPRDLDAESREVRKYVTQPVWGGPGDYPMI